MRMDCIQMNSGSCELARKQWREFLSEFVKNMFRGWGYVYEVGINYGTETESDSNVEIDN